MASADPLAPPEGYGASPLDWPVPADSETCTMTGCQLASIWLYLLACEHEHIARLNPCEMHAVVIDHQLLVCHAPRKNWFRTPRGGWWSQPSGAICGARMKVECRERLVLTEA